MKAARLEHRRRHINVRVDVDKDSDAEEAESFDLTPMNHSFTARVRTLESKGEVCHSCCKP